MDGAVITYATVEDVAAMFRPLTAEEQERAGYLLETVSAEIRLRADALEKDFDAMIAKSPDLGIVAKAVTVDTVGRILNQSTTGEAMTQMSQSGLGYVVSGSYLVPGGGSLLLNRDLKRLGLLRARYGTIDIYGVERMGEVDA